MSGADKRRKELSLKEKQLILESYDRLPKMSQRSAALRLKISQSVLCNLLKKRSVIEASALTGENLDRKRKRCGKDRQVETALKNWFSSVCDDSGTVNGPLLRKKAEELARTMGRDNFSATDGWFNRWKKRENIVCSRIRGDKINGSEMAMAMPEICEVILDGSPNMKEEPEEGEEEKTPPTNAEMEEALRLLRRGVQCRTGKMDKHYEYEQFIQELLQMSDEPR